MGYKIGFVGNSLQTTCNFRAGVMTELVQMGYEVVIINNNPETVSTDFDIADKLYFEPLTREDVENIVKVEKPDGAIVQFGGQTAIKLTKDLTEMGVKIMGTQEVDMDRAEDTIHDWIYNGHRANYYMLLCKELSYYTLFHSVDNCLIEEDFIRDFQRETETFINPERQIKYEQELEYDDLEI